MPENNPWIDEHINREVAFQDGDRSWATQIVEGEYLGAPESCHCEECGARAHYKATIGCLKCPDCGALYTGCGDPI